MWFRLLLSNWVKGLVHPKKKMIIILLTPKLFQTCMNFFVMWNIKEDILRNVYFATKQLCGTIDFHSIFRSILWQAVKGSNQLFGYWHSSKCLSFVFSRRKKLIQVWNDLRARKFFIFGWTISWTSDLSVNNRTNLGDMIEVTAVGSDGSCWFPFQWEVF